MSIHKQKLLRITAPHFVAGAVWEFNHGWVCVDAAPIIKWMVGKPPAQIRDYILKKNWSYEWLSIKK